MKAKLRLLTLTENHYLELSFSLFQSGKQKQKLIDKYEMSEHTISSTLILYYKNIFLEFLLILER